MSAIPERPEQTSSEGSGKATSSEANELLPAAAAEISPSKQPPAGDEVPVDKLEWVSSSADVAEPTGSSRGTTLVAGGSNSSSDGDSVTSPFQPPAPSLASQPAPATPPKANTQAALGNGTPELQPVRTQSDAAATSAAAAVPAWGADGHVEYSAADTPQQQVCCGPAQDLTAGS